MAEVGFMFKIRDKVAAGLTPSFASSMIDSLTLTPIVAFVPTQREIVVHMPLEGRFV
ncbi:hypothetical protein L917_18423 [Phytophthora nicotianae]|uniref:Uncharacterized protein n=1 Tax=Phytophthora nicotianae TaxID=4792 RepID=W2MFX4_PHYNI|nr:hypothetical protein L917_18423 [Phytophthora nicotianae]ETM34394.1 hypothetical protein L914_18510 [Phytophthora nicotianae]